MRNSIIYESQYGFRQGHSTIHAVSEFIENVIDGFDKRESTLAVFLDLSKAFDTIDHNILLQKLKFYGIRGNAFDWFTSYLSHRVQYVALEDYNSDRYFIKCGVPQGSVLGPLLFLIYINDLPKNLSHCKSILFADDANIFRKSKHLSELFNLVNEDLKLVADWFNSNRLSLNIAKTHYVIFKPNKQKIPDLQILIESTPIDCKQCIKFLGILIDNQLSWKPHVDYVKGRLTSALFALRRMKSNTSTHNSLTVYYSLFHSHMNYGLILGRNN